MLHIPELLLLDCFRFSFSTCWSSRCLAAAPSAQLFAAAAAGETVAVLLASCLLLLPVVDASACTVIVLCAVAGAELSAAAADGETVAVLLASYLFLLYVAGARSCTFFLLSSCFFRLFARDGIGLRFWAEPAWRKPGPFPPRALLGSA